MRFQRIDHRGLQSGTRVLIEVLEQGPTHAGLPEASDVTADPGRTYRGVRIGLEERGDLVGHLDEFLGVHGIGISGATTGCSALADGAQGQAWGINAVWVSLNLWNCSCQSDEVVVGLTSTAVTLYSGQLVAQSELSVVTTFAPESG